MFSKGEVREFFVVGRSWIDAVVIRKVGGRRGEGELEIRAFLEERQVKVNS
jgi:hypothetical protein